MAGRRSGADERPLPAHPYRDTVVVYGIMGVVLIVIASVTGGNLVRALAVGVGFFVLATGWSWWRFRTRIREREAREALATQGVRPVPGRPCRCGRRRSRSLSLR